MLLLLLPLLSILIPFAQPLSFNFSAFDRTTPVDFQRDAFFNKVIKLTKNELGSPITDSVGRAIYTHPVSLWDADTRELTHFTTHFSFVIDSFNSSPYGDGLAFFLSPYPSTIPDNSSGGYLGLFSNISGGTSSPVIPTVAVEFNSFEDEWDPSSDHVGINVNSIKSIKTVQWNSSIKNGRTANAWVSYNATTMNLTVFLTYKDNPIYSGNSTLSCTIDLRDILPEEVAIGFSAATGEATEIHNILSWDFISTLEPTRKSKLGLVVGLPVGLGFLIITTVGLLWFASWRKRTSGGKEEIAMDDAEFEKLGRGPKRFPYSELAAATKNFAEEKKLGEGGFGAVYRGYLTDSKLDVAIKRVSRGSKQGKKEYISEVKIISRLRHRNLVQLVGWCHDNGYDQLVLVYEFMPNGSLDSHLYSGNMLLQWATRYNIALGLASALLYLHEEWEQCVVHRDVKPSNVMLDSAFNAKLGDFGLARLVDHESGLQTTVLAGTMGYLALECVATGKESKESDVYSFGVVALEIATGRRALEPKEKQLSKVRLVEWVWDLYGKKALVEAADERLEKEFVEKQMERLMVVGLWCAYPDYNLRPSIRQAIAVLKCEAPLPELPPKMPVPIYYAPPMDACRFSYTSSVGSSGYTTKSSNSTVSPSASSS